MKLWKRLLLALCITYLLLRAYDKVVETRVKTMSFKEQSSIWWLCNERQQPDLEGLGTELGINKVVGADFLIGGIESNPAPEGVGLEGKKRYMNWSREPSGFGSSNYVKWWLNPRN